MYLLYNALLAVVLLLGLPYWVLRALRHGKRHLGLAERLGKVPDRLARHQSRPAIWVHSVSVGELIAVSDLITELTRRFPGYRVVVSTTTAAGQSLARSRFGRNSVFYFPLDFRFAIHPYLQILRPQLIVIAETEFWPNFLRLAYQSRARIAIVNARISDRSWPGYRRFRCFWMRVLQPIDIFLTQTEEDRRRLADIGAPVERIQVSFPASAGRTCAGVRQYRGG